MAVQLNHTIVSANDSHASASFLTEILGRPAPTAWGPFLMVELDNDVTLDFMDAEGEIVAQHYAFLISEDEFDASFGRIRDRGVGYWADPSHRRAGEINRNDGGRGVYFEDPKAPHNYEIFTRPYGSGG